MSIPAKLVLCLASVSAIILGAYGFREYRREERELTAGAKREMMVLGTALQVAIENALRDGRLSDVQEVIEPVKSNDSSIDVLFFNPAGLFTSHPFGSRSSAELVREGAYEVTSSQQPVVRVLGPRNSSRIVGFFPLRPEHGANLGSIAVMRSLDGLRAALRSVAISIVVPILTLIVALASIAWLVVYIYVRRPLMSLMTAMKDVRAGNLTASVPVQRTDEVGMLTVEFNSMVRELEGARRHLIEATESREALEAGLRRVDKLATLGQLSAGLAHEIGSPLQILNGRARALVSRTDLSAEVRRTAQVFEEQTDRIAKIVEQLLTTVRRRVARRDEIDLGATVAPIVDLVGHEARRRAVRIQFERPTTPLWLVADGDQVEQVTLNLLSNALRATPRGGQVLLRLAASAFKAPDETVERPSVSLELDDTGCGIPEGLLGHIFEPFFTTWAEAGGAGLGLAVVKSIVAEHGGTIAVSSEKDVGTRFTVHFPVAAVARAKGVVA